MYEVINNLFCLCFIDPEVLCFPLRGGGEQNNRGKYLGMRRNSKESPKGIKYTSFTVQLISYFNDETKNNGI